MKCVVSVLGDDRCGIVAAIAQLLAKHNVNIDDISQTIIQGVFSMTMIVSLDEEHTSFNALQEELAQVASDLQVQAGLQRRDVFSFMHEI